MTKTTAFTLSVTLALTVATPTITPNGGNFSGTVSVAMQTATSGASIYYTTDGSTPTQSSTLYTGTMALASSATVNAKAFKSGSNPSSIASASFTNTGTGKTTYYVAKTGSNSNSCAQAQNPSTPKLTFGAGLQCMMGGDRLEIKQGTYEEDLYSAGILPPSGTLNNRTVIATFGNDTVTFTNKSSLNWYSGNFSYVDFIGGCSSGINRSCKLVWDGTGTIMVNGTMTKQIAGSDISFNSATSAQHIRFDGVRVTNWGGVGVFPGSNNTWRNCRVDHNGWDNNTNAAQRLPGYAFYIGGSDLLLENCEIDNNGGSGIQQYTSSGASSANIYRYNIFHDNGRTPSSAQQADGLIIGAQCTATKVYGNLFYGIGHQNGIRVDYGCTGTAVYNNTVHGTSLAGIAIESRAASTVVRNNIVYGNGLPGITNNGIGTSLSNNITTDPKFVSTSNNDFHLQSGSPAVNAGATLAEVLFDIDGTPRPSGSAYDIGAYEYRQ